MSPVVIVAGVVVAVSVWLFLTRRSTTCSLCNHPMSAHRRTAKEGAGRHNSFCLRCNRECS